MKVLRFSIGFGKPIWMRIGGKDRTEYCVSAIPLGGYVRFLDTREGPIPESDEGLIAIHEFVPALPWWFYTKTQAKAHLVVMWLFGRHVRLLAKEADEGYQVVEAPTN